MDEIDKRVKVDDMVQVKSTSSISSFMVSANAASIPLNAPKIGSPLEYFQVWDGRVGKVIAIKDDDLTNTAIIVKIDEHEVVLWLWQVEKLANISPE